MKTKYRVLSGIDYLGKRAEAGAIVDDLPRGSVAWLLRDGIIEKLDKSEKSEKLDKSKTFEETIIDEEVEQDEL